MTRRELIKSTIGALFGAKVVAKLPEIPPVIEPPKETYNYIPYTCHCELLPPEMLPSTAETGEWLAQRLPHSESCECLLCKP